MLQKRRYACLELDEARIHAMAAVTPPTYMLKVGLVCIAIPPTDEVKPNFRTPPNC